MPKDYDSNLSKLLVIKLCTNHWEEVKGIPLSGCGRWRSSHQLTWFHLLETAEYVYEEGQTATPPSLCLCEDADYELLSASSTLLLVTSNHRGSLLILTLSCDDGDGGL
ncbi:hypothetical protein NC653_022554 [Populus alba x Populus x berolinensis]|uniref:Uncharacterized protein n=1 Tax=Populus alba x Populus x berolinensis TaxID=444605 RepID=A0AAD6Q9L3_9ROSI|nr:hypothetical protein NC653_022554 [Populus alba x Populus x berolinensis]